MFVVSEFVLLQVTTSSMVGVRHHTLMLADTENEKTKWVVALNELHRILRRNKLPNRQVRHIHYPPSPPSLCVNRGWNIC